MTYQQAKSEVAKKHSLGTTLVTGHKASYFEEAALLYAGATSELSQQLADEQAVDFAEFISDNQFSRFNHVWTSTKIHYMGTKYSAEQLFNLFKNRAK